ncbi:MAG: HNH endonuclease [Ardenticatenia bacterium]|nr:HNH endonuclease [Ardenticatenia bacterium]
MSSTVSAQLRRRVHERAKDRCEYCLIPETATLLKHEVDHVIAVKHGGETTDDNLSLSCRLCNRRKGSDIAAIDPDTGRTVPLFHPRRDSWSEHFEIEGALLLGRTVTGRATIALLQLNRSERVAERKLLLASGLLP